MGAQGTGSAGVQGELWSADPEGWAQWAEPALRPLYDAVLERVRARRPPTLLDAGCGAGLLAALAAADGVRVTGLDAAPGLVARAAARTPAGTFVVGDLEHLPFADGAFACVTALNCVLYATDPARALAELARVAAPGGHVLVTLGTGADSDESAALVDPLIPPGVEASSRLTADLTDPRELRAALAAAGLDVVECAVLAFPVAFADVDAAVAAQLPAGPVAAALRHAGRDAVEHALRTFFMPRRRPDGTVVVRDEYVVAAATRPSPRARVR
jgi:SAM-dependent methyltransferase